MEKGNKFVNDLEANVDDVVKIEKIDKEIEGLNKSIEEYKKLINSKQNAIKYNDNRKDDEVDVEALQKNITEYEKRIKALMAQKESIKSRQEVEVTVDESGEEKVEKKEEEKEEENKEKEEKDKKEDIEEENNIEKENTATEKGYKDAMENLYEYRRQLYNKMHSENRIIKTEEEMDMEIELINKASMYRGEELSQEDKDSLEANSQSARHQANVVKENVQNGCAKYERYMLEMYNLQKQLNELNRDRDNGKLNEEDYKKEKEEIMEKKVNLRKEIKNLKPEELREAIRQQGEIERVEGGIKAQAYEDASFEEQRNLKYDKSKDVKSINNLTKAIREEQVQPKESLKASKERLEKLKKQLDDTPKEEIEKRNRILNDMETELIVHEREQKIVDSAKNGEEITSEKMEKDEDKLRKEVEEKVKEQNKDNSDINAAMEEKNKIAGAATLATIGVLAGKEKLQKDEPEGKEVTTPIVSEEQEFHPISSFDEELNKMTNDIGTPEEANAYLAVCEKADRKIEERTNEVEKKVNGEI